MHQQTSLLMAILGELALTKGARHVQGSIAYVPQEPWVMSDTVRSNIIMDSDFDQEFYDRVLEACTLDVVSTATMIRMADKKYSIILPKLQLE